MSAMLMKLARIREDGVPVGIPARLYLNCPCGERLWLPDSVPVSEIEEVRVASTCGYAYDIEGYVVARPEDFERGTERGIGVPS